MTVSATYGRPKAVPVELYELLAEEPNDKRRLLDVFVQDLQQKLQERQFNFGSIIYYKGVRSGNFKELVVRL